MVKETPKTKTQKELQPVAPILNETLEGRTFMDIIGNNGSDVLSSRAKRVCNKTKLSFQKVIDGLTTDFYDLQDKLAELTDMSPDTRDSLRVAEKGFNSDEWVQQYQKLTMELNFNQIQLNIALQNKKELFGE